MATTEAPLPVLSVVTNIARRHLGIQTLATANSDAADCHDLAVWSIQAALEAAYAAGQQAKGET